MSRAQLAMTAMLGVSGAVVAGAWLRAYRRAGRAGFVPCQRCDGHGRVLANDDEEAGWLLPCPMCGGTGALVFGRRRRRRTR